MAADLNYFFSFQCQTEEYEHREAAAMCIYERAWPDERVVLGGLWGEKGNGQHPGHEMSWQLVSGGELESEYLESCYPAVCQERHRGTVALMRAAKATLHF